MNTTSEDRSRVKLAAQEGDIDGLYTVIKEKPHVLEDIDSIPFVDTPLHVAASFGNLQFATEVMRLKPSFAWKLNPEGLTPIHLALQKDHDKVVSRFVDINKDLVRAKGREGFTPLHLATEKGEIYLLIKFLLACPDSIEDVTVKSETALHIAVRCGQYEALQVLVGWLMRTSQKGARELESRILNWKDEEGNSILHVAARENNLQMVQLLVKAKVGLKAKNVEGRSALDIATSEEIRSILGAGRAAEANLHVSDVPRPTFADLLKSKMTLIDRILTYIYRLTSYITEEQRNAYLIIAVLVITATYQSALSPPGGVYQANAGDKNANATSLNSTATATHGKKAGTSVLPGHDFFAVSIGNVLSFLSSIFVIPFMIQPGLLILLYGPIGFLTGSYLASLSVISSTGAWLPHVYMVIPFAFLFFPFMAVLAFLRGKIYHGQRAGVNRW